MVDWSLEIRRIYLFLDYILQGAFQLRNLKIVISHANSLPKTQTNKQTQASGQLCNGVTVVNKCNQSNA